MSVVFEHSVHTVIEIEYNHNNLNSQYNHQQDKIYIEDIMHDFFTSNLRPSAPVALNGGGGGGVGVVAGGGVAAALFANATASGGGGSATANLRMTANL